MLQPTFVSIQLRSMAFYNLPIAGEIRPLSRTNDEELP
jgi:hypothetical protein